MTPTPLAIVLLGVAAVTALVAPTAVAVALMLAVVAATVTDAAFVRRPPTIDRRCPTFLSRGVEAALVITVDTGFRTKGSASTLRSPTVASTPPSTPSSEGATCWRRRRCGWWDRWGSEPGTTEWGDR